MAVNKDEIIMKKEVSDQELVESLYVGDMLSAEALVSRYAEKVFSIAMSLTSNTKESERISEEVLVQVISNILEGSKEGAEAQFRRVAYELSIASLIGRIDAEIEKVSEMCGKVIEEEPKDEYFDEIESVCCSLEAA